MDLTSKVYHILFDNRSIVRSESDMWDYIRKTHTPTCTSYEYIQISDIVDIQIISGTTLITDAEVIIGGTLIISISKGGMGVRHLEVDIRDLSTASNDRSILWYEGSGKGVIYLLTDEDVYILGMASIANIWKVLFTPIAKKARYIARRYSETVSVKGDLEIPTTSIEKGTYHLSFKDHITDAGVITDHMTIDIYELLGAPECVIYIDANVYGCPLHRLYPAHTENEDGSTTIIGWYFDEIFMTSRVNVVTSLVSLMRAHSGMEFKGLTYKTDSDPDTIELTDIDTSA